jgi:triosephosphate isomerase
MPHKKIIAANWKMNKGLVEALKFVEELKAYLEKNPGIDCEIIICPPFISLDTVYKNTKVTDIKLGAQNVYFENNGAYTGEISCSMLKSCGCKYVIAGHSERRQYFGETNEIVNKKVLKILDEGLKPILCVGETSAERQDHLTEAVIEEQLKVCLNHVYKEQINKVVIAYEPVWAIGTGKNATPHQAETVHNFIRKKIKKMFDEESSAEIKILYGGSVTPDNAKELFTTETINGGLVGGASLEENKFTEIINAASKSFVNP